MHCSDQSTGQLLLAVLKQEAVAALCCPFQKRPRNYKLAHQK